MGAGLEAIGRAFIQDPAPGMPALVNPAPELILAGPQGATPRVGTTAVLAQWSAVLSAFPGLKLSEVEQGMREFLDQLERLGQGAAGRVGGGGLSLWVAAGVLALAACEMARRQLRGPDRVPPLELVPFPDLDEAR
jgi:hypothetical protein